jgi:hypothetical protein
MEFSVCHVLFAHALISQRMMGFGICFGAGYLITFMSFSFFVQLVEGDPVPFVVVYTVGHILSLMSSMFLCGPKRQFKYVPKNLFPLLLFLIVRIGVDSFLTFFHPRNMFDEKRRYTSIVFLSCLFATLVVVFIPIDGTIKLVLLLLLLVTQFSASLWYTLSYIPYGRRTFMKILKGVFGIEEEG